MADAVERHCRRLDQQTLSAFVYRLWRHEGWTVTPGPGEGWFRLRRDTRGDDRYLYVCADELDSESVAEVRSRDGPVTVVCPLAGDRTFAAALDRDDAVTVVDASALAVRAASAYPDVSLASFDRRALPSFVPFRGRLESMPPQRVAALVSAVTAGAASITVFTASFVPFWIVVAGLAVLYVAARQGRPWAPSSVGAVAVFALVGGLFGLIGTPICLWAFAAKTGPLRLDAVVLSSVVAATFVLCERIHGRLLGV